MPDPNFEQSARGLFEALGGVISDRTRERVIATTLRQVWNARGDADSERLESYGATYLGAELRSLDR